MTTFPFVNGYGHQDEPEAPVVAETAAEAKERVLGAAIAVCRANQLRCVEELKKHHRPLIGPMTSEVAGIRLGLADWCMEEAILLRELMS